MSSLLDLIAGRRRVSIVGMCKNAGKTTVLNRLIAECRAAGVSAALFSVGRDGERNDVITNMEKPGIFVEEGTMFATTSDLLKLCAAESELLLSTGAGTPLGEVIVLRALSGGFVQLSGPSMNARIPELIDTFFRRGADMVLIDGAMSRKASVSPAVAGCSILCTGADYDPDINKVVADTAHAARMLSAPALQDGKAAEIIASQSRGDVVIIGKGYDAAVCGRNELLLHAGRTPEAALFGAAFVYFPGALTDSVCLTVLRRPKSSGEIVVVADDASKLMISREVFSILESRGVKVCTLDPVELACICINPHCTTGPDFSKTRFMREMSGATGLPVINVADRGG